VKDSDYFFKAVGFDFLGDSEGEREEFLFKVKKSQKKISKKKS